MASGLARQQTEGENEQTVQLKDIKVEPQRGDVATVKLIANAGGRVGEVSAIVKNHSDILPKGIQVTKIRVKRPASEPSSQPPDSSKRRPSNTSTMSEPAQRTHDATALPSSNSIANGKCPIAVKKDIFNTNEVIAIDD